MDTETGEDEKDEMSSTERTEDGDNSIQQNEADERVREICYNDTVKHREMSD